MAHLVLHRGDAGRWTPCASDASDGARQDAVADAALQLQELLGDADVGKSVDPELVDRVPGAFLAFRPVQSEAEPPDAAELCTPGEARSAA